MDVTELIEDLKGRARTLQSRIFPTQVLLELQDTRLVGQALLQGKPGRVFVDVPLPAQSCKAGFPIEIDALADLLGELMLGEKLLDAHVMAALPLEAVHWRVLDWANAPAPEQAIEALRALNPELGLPFPLSEATIDLRPLPTAPQKLLLAATSHQVVDSWIEVFDQAGLNLDRLAAPQSCRLAALQRELGEFSPDLLVLLIGPEETRGRPFMAIRGGVPLFERILVEKGDRMVAEFERCVTFLRKEFDNAHDLGLLLEGSLEERDALESTLGQPLLDLEVEPFGSLVMKGLAIPELTP